MAVATALCFSIECVAGALFNRNNKTLSARRKDPKYSEFTAPQHTNDGDPSVEKAAKEWCASMNGKTVTNGGDIPYKFNKHGLSSFWLSASKLGAERHGMQQGGQDLWRRLLQIHDERCGKVRTASEDDSWSCDRQRLCLLRR